VSVAALRPPGRDVQLSDCIGRSGLARESSFKIAGRGSFAPPRYGVSRRNMSRFRLAKRSRLDAHENVTETGLASTIAAHQQRS